MEDKRYDPYTGYGSKMRIQHKNIIHKMMIHTDDIVTKMIT